MLYRCIRQTELKSPASRSGRIPDAVMPPFPPVVDRSSFTPRPSSAPLVIVHALEYAISIDRAVKKTMYRRQDKELDF